MARMLGEGAVEAAGKSWRLRFDMNVLADLQERTGKTPVQVMSELQGEGGSVLMLRTVCHAMLKRHHPEAAIEVAGDILSENLDDLMKIIQAAMPDPTAAAGPDAGGSGNAVAKAG